MRNPKRTLSQMNDSGYYSSLESSIMRDDNPRIKRGRAEEEIARIRQPHHESPTRRSTGSRGLLRTSSPPYDINAMLPPLTPATTLRPRPPRSVSPQTHLRLHRDGIRRLIGSPKRDLEVLGDEPWGSTLAALVCHQQLMDCDDSGDSITRTCFGTPEQGLGSAKFDSGNQYDDLLFDAPDLFGVGVGFERFTNDCPDSPSTRSELRKSQTARF